MRRAGRVTERGRPSKSDFGRYPNVFELTYIHGAYGEEPTHEWRRHKTLADAIKVAQHARLAKDEKAVGKSKVNAARKSDAREGKMPRTGPESPLQTPSVQPRNPTLQSQVRKRGHQSRFREGVRRHD